MGSVGGKDAQGWVASASAVDSRCRVASEIHPAVPIDRVGREAVWARPSGVVQNVVVRRHGEHGLRCRTSRRRALFRLRVLILNVGTQQARAKNSSSIITKNMVTEDLTRDLSWLRSAPNTKHQTPKNAERPSRQRWERVTSGDAV